METLHDLGLDPWIEAHAAAQDMEGCGLARVSAVDRGAYRVRDASGEFAAEPSGRLLYASESPACLPCVGDWTAVRRHDGGAAVIHRVLPRRSFLRRKAPGRGADVQMIAANLDAAFIVQSCHFDFNPGRLERYLVMAADGRVEPVVLLTKTDLITPGELEDKLAILRSVTRAGVIALSAVAGTGLGELRQALLPGRTYCLLGSSGVGKTTLLNRLLGREAFAAKAVSGTGEGTHTTTRRQLVVLDQGALLIDTPGMRELGVAGAAAGVAAEFEEIAALAPGCRYADCGHEHEPDCAVRAAVAAGDLDPARYAAYLKLRKEARHYDMSPLDRRKKDRAFGRFLNSAKKRMKR